MRFKLNERSEAVTVYTSKREAIDVKPGGVIDTNDEALIYRLKNDSAFSEPKSEAEPVTQAEPVAEPVIEQFVTEAPKPKGKRGRKSKRDAGSA